jgi:hypothetical protein
LVLVLVLVGVWKGGVVRTPLSCHWHGAGGLK